MASTYSNLKFELIGTGDQSGTWGTTTNTNLGTAIEQALVGMATISSGFTGSPLTLTLTLTDTNAAQNARALVLNLTQALGSAGTLNVPAIQKPYMIINATGQTVTVKVTGLTGVAVPTGKRAFLYNNGTDVGNFFNYADTLSLGTDLAVADGGTGASDAPTARTNLGATTVGGNLFTLTNPSAVTFLRINADNTVSALSAADFRTAIGASSSSGTVTCVNTSNGPGPINGLTLTGGPITSSGTVTLGGGVNVSTITTGVLPVARGGTGLCAVGSSGNVLTSNGTAWVSQAAGGGANIQTFSATGTYTKPPGAKFIYVELWGAGGGGGAGAWNQSNPTGSCQLGGAGGGGGAYTYRMFAAPAIGATETVTIGAGGAAGISKAPPIPANCYGSVGGNGGATNFGTYLYAGGGKGGAGSAGRGGSAVAVICNTPVFQSQILTANASTTTSSAATSFFGCGPIRINYNGVYSGGRGGESVAYIRCQPGTPAPIAVAQAGRGYLSAFGGGGGGAGAPAYISPGNVYCNVSGFVGGAGLAFGGTTGPTLSLTFPNTTIACGLFGRGGGGTGTPSSFGFGGQGGNSNSGPSPVSPLCIPSTNGNAGGTAGGGGGAASILYFVATRAGNGGAGGNGYAVVYTW